MSAEKDIRGPLQGFAAKGFSAAYDLVRQRDERELAKTEAGPREGARPLPPDGTDLKNPHGDFQHPAPMAGDDGLASAPAHPGGNAE